MGTTVVNPKSVHRPVNKQYERVFFVGMALLLLATVVIGFWPSYFSKGAVAAPLPSVLVHFHGAVFTLWMALFAVQVGLISAKKVKVHRTLGLSGMGLAVLMVVLGVMTGTAALHRRLIHGGRWDFDPRIAYILPMGDIALFAPVIFFAFWMRSKPDIHKRLVLIATIALMGAPLSRFPFAVMHTNVFAQSFVMAGFLLMLVAYDLFSLRRVHRATIWGSVYFVFIHALRFPLAFTPAWHWFADRMGRLG